MRSQVTLSVTWPWKARRIACGAFLVFSYFSTYEKQFSSGVEHPPLRRRGAFFRDESEHFTHFAPLKVNRSQLALAYALCELARLGPFALNRQQVASILAAPHLFSMPRTSCSGSRSTEHGCLFSQIPPAPQPDTHPRSGNIGGQVASSP